MTAARPLALAMLPLAWVLSAGAVAACSPALQTPAARPERGPACSQVWRVDRIRSVALGEAQDLGGGKVLQFVTDGNGCYWETNVIVHDCARGEVVGIGADHVALMERPKGRTALDRVVDQIEAAGPALTLEAVEAAARKAGLATVFRMRTTNRLNVNGRRLAVDCACRTVYPGLGPKQ